ncbi:MAG TPA: hypothetical protein PKD53_31195, partial [Chloroflexaceae bacterium]|nr:hypothetical protein [Chloroflexaceae bacterium]
PRAPAPPATVAPPPPPAPGAQPTVPPFPYQPGPPAPLPETTAGVPLLGILLGGMTLLTRTWRLHRAKERI